MNKKLILFLVLMANCAYAADIKLSQLPLGTASATNVNDSFPYVDFINGVTRRLKLSDLINLPQINATYAPLASPTFTGVVTAPTFVGALTGNATSATTAANFGGSLSGDVTGTQSATVISAATVTGKAITGYASGAGTITAADSILTAINKLNGNFQASGAISALTGDVTASGPGSSAATVALVGGSSASSVNTATTLVNTSQSGNKFLASPSGGGSGAPAFRAVVPTDIPTLNQDTSGNAATVTTNANLSGPITSVGNATSVASQTGTGSTFAMSASPTFTGTLGAASILASGTVLGSNLSGSNTGDVTLGTANGLSLVGQALSLALSSTSTTGALSSTDWNTFNGKGSVSSVDLSVPSFLSVSGNPITTSGTLAVSYSGTALPVLNGGTGSTTSTGSGSVVLSSSPALVTPALGAATATSLVASGAVSGSNLTSGGHAILDVASSSLGDLTDVGTDGIIVIGGTGSVIGSVSLAQSVATTSQNGYLSSTDWTTFNSKQPAGNYVTSLTGDVVAAGPGSSSATIQSHVVSNSKLAQMPTLTVKGNNSGITADASDLTVAQLDAILPTFTSTLNGLVPFSGGGTTNFLRADGIWTPAGTGSVSSIALTVPAFLSVSGSPVTSTGTLAVSFSGSALPIANGGTNATSKSAAFDSLSPMTTGGDLIYGGASGTGTRLANGSAGQLLQSNGTTLAPSWVPAPSTSPLTTKGDLYTFSTVNARLPVGTDGQVLYADSTQTSGIKWAGPQGSNPTVQNFSGNGSTTAFTLSVAPVTLNNTEVYVSGIYQQKSTYSVSGTTLTFTEAPPSGSSNVEVVTGTNFSIGTPSNGTVTGASFATQTAGTFLAGPTSGSSATPTFRALQAPTIQKFTSGSGTYTKPAGVLYLRVRMVSGGGGGSGAGTGSPVAGSNGGSTTFGSSLLTCTGGSGGPTGVADGGAGGTATISAPAYGTAITGGSGDGSYSTALSMFAVTTRGGMSPYFAGGGAAAYSTRGSGNAGITNTGGGGSGGNTNTANGNNSGSGGGSGAFIEAIVPSPSSSYSYSVGGGGAGGAGGTNGAPGNTAADGVIIVEEYFQ